MENIKRQLEQLYPINMGHKTSSINSEEAETAINNKTVIIDQIEEISNFLSIPAVQDNRMKTRSSNIKSSKTTEKTKKTENKKKNKKNENKEKKPWR